MYHISMIMNKRMKSALDLAIVKHKGQVDKAGKDYIGHPLRVAIDAYTDALEMGADNPENYFIVGILHDVHEDCDVSLDYIEEQFGKVVRDAIYSVSRIKLPIKETYTQFVDRAKLNLIGRVVKKADLRDNMDPERIACLHESEQDIVRRYNKAMKSILDYESELERQLAEKRHHQMLIDGGGA